MLIQLKCEEGSGADEWCILEFQGELLGEMGPGAHVGELIEVKGTDVKMVIGQHILEGKIVKMPKPFTIFESDGDCLDMRGVIRKKILFKIRPKPRGQVHGII